MPGMLSQMTNKNYLKCSQYVFPVHSHADNRAELHELPYLPFLDLLIPSATAQTCSEANRKYSQHAKQGVSRDPFMQITRDVKTAAAWLFLQRTGTPGPPHSS